VSYTNAVNRNIISIVITSYRPLWDVTIAGPPRCPEWCRLVTVPIYLFATFTRPTGPFLSEWMKCQPGNTQNGGTILPIVNLMEDSESESPVSYLSLLVTICLSGLVSVIFACDRQTDNTDHCYSWLSTNEMVLTQVFLYAYIDCCCYWCRSQKSRATRRRVTKQKIRSGDRHYTVTCHNITLSHAVTVRCNMP